MLSQTGALHILWMLTHSDRVESVGDLVRDRWNPDGIASDRSIIKARNNLLELGLTKELKEDSPPFKKQIVATEKGKLVVQKLKEILTIINSDR